jgi:hypothetical protein
MAWLVDRFTKKWGLEVKDLQDKINSSKPNEDDYIYHEVKDEVERIISKNDEPDEATIEVHGLIVKKKIVHRKTEKYNGADVYLEVEGVKFALVQFKLASVDRFYFDEKEFKNLEKWCNFCSADPSRLRKCPALVWLIRYHGDIYEKHRILRLCELRVILGKRLSVNIEEVVNVGWTRRTFLELLVMCKVGAPFERKPNAEELFGYSESLNRLLVSYSVSKLETP